MVRVLLNRNYKWRFTWPFLGRDHGQTMVEYSLLLVMIVLGLFAVIGVFGGTTLDHYYSKIVDVVANVL